MLLDAGLTDVELEVIQPSYREGPGKRIASVTMEHIREAVVGNGLASDEEINDVVDELNSFAGNPRTMMSLPRIFQVWGKKRMALPFVGLEVTTRGWRAISHGLGYGAPSVSRAAWAAA